jgi:hypothetical protein
MSDPTTTPPPTSAPALAATILAACAIAAGRATADPAAAPVRTRTAHKNLNCKGHGEEWYRMRWDGTQWIYFGERLPSGSFRASDRKAEAYGEAYPGDILVQHDRGGAIDAAYVVTEGHDKGGRMIHVAAGEVCRQRDGQLRITLPDGTEILRPNPRK